MKMKNNFLIFLTIGILLFVFLYFSDFYFNLNIGDTYYVVNYFYVALLFLILGSVLFLAKWLKKRKTF